MIGPTSMYTIRPIIKISEEIEYPKCMYMMKNLQKSHVTYAKKSTNITNSTSVLEQVKKLLKMPLPEVMALETRQEAILDQLAQLKEQITGLREGLKQSIPSTPQRSRKLTITNIPAQNGLIHDIVINASPKHPPYSILALYHLWGETLKLNISCHIHSTVHDVPEHLLSFRPTNSAASKNSPLLNITIVWKEVGPDTELIVSPLKHVAVRGEVNILRYLTRLGPPQFNYELSDAPADATQVDATLDACYLLSRCGAGKEQRALIGALAARLGKERFLSGGNQPSVADIAVWSALKQAGDAKLGGDLARWFDQCSRTFKMGK
uniref:(California timema) hypothetical protein n=2 Tax=Timema californicum TaxID=61474 RepID=A0A7R9JGQ6_TIMCA|nr:unnamed protein product [Timema californicum]